MYIADVPTPLGVPFAYFPLSRERSVSGFILPQPGETRQRGFSLQNGGYYFISVMEVMHYGQIQNIVCAINLMVV